MTDLIQASPEQLADAVVRGTVWGDVPPEMLALLDQEYTRVSVAEMVRERIAREKHGPAGKITDHGIKDLLSLPAPVCLVDGTVQEETIVLIHGPQGVLKTFVLLDLMMKASGPGGSWLTKKILTTGPCAFFAGEGRSGLGVRARGWVAGHGGMKPEQFHAPRHEGIDLLNPDDEAAVTEYLTITSPDGWLLVAFDAKADFMETGDEDKQTDTSRFIAACRRIRDKAKVKCVIVIAHPGNQNQHRARGSSRQGNAFDTIFRVTHGHVTDNAQRGGKQRDLAMKLEADFHPVMVTLDDGTTSLYIDDGTNLTYLSDVHGGHDDLDGAIIQIVRNNQGRLTMLSTARLLRHDGEVPDGIVVNITARTEGVRTITRHITALIEGPRPVIRRDGAGHLHVIAEEADDDGSEVGQNDGDQLT